ncbi:MAG TPA: hypothetical protein VII95_07190 [Terriglobales bacterium]|jgi:hypothetical protein
MTETELQKTVKQQLTEAGLGTVIDYESSQFFTVPEGVFAEVVLTDASHQAEASLVLAEMAEALRAQGVELTSIVRSLWQVGDIRYVEPAWSPEGGISTALRFSAELKSGNRTQFVFVHVTIVALTELRQKLGKEDFLMHIGWLPEKGDVDEGNISAAIKSYLEIQLESGGMSYWDPLVNRELELDEAAMSYVLGHSPAFQELRAAITDAFSDPVVKSFLKSLSVSGGTLSNFEAVLTELSNMLGGAFDPRQRFSISATELFNGLNAVERELIKQYVALCVQKARAFSALL